jgi:hypothetical protein
MRRISLSLALAAGLLIPSDAIAAPVAWAGDEPVLCYYGSRVYSPFYALRITAPRHLPALAVASLSKAGWLTGLNVGAAPGRFTLVVGGQKPSSSFPYSSYWRLKGRARCNYRVVHINENTHLMVRCTHGGTVVTFSVPPSGNTF